MLKLSKAYVCLSILVNAASLNDADAVCQYEENGGETIQEHALLQIASSSSSSVARRLARKLKLNSTCGKLGGRSYVSGAHAAMSEAGYQQTAALCCHHEMSLFVAREIATQGFDICALSDLHGFVHWYDCTDDGRNYATLKNEIASVHSSQCPWLGKNSICPVKGPNCRPFTPCGVQIPPDSLPGSSAPLSLLGYQKVALRCCHVEMEQFTRREIARQGFFVCDEGGLQGFLHWYDCDNDGQTYDQMKREIAFAQSGNPCPWLGVIGTPCPPKGHNCPVVETGPAVHRRRTSCR